MAQLPNDTKYHVTTAIRQITESHLEKALDGYLDYGSLEVHEVDHLVFNIRITPNGGGAARYITVKVSESW